MQGPVEESERPEEEKERRVGRGGVDGRWRMGDVDPRRGAGGDIDLIVARAWWKGVRDWMEIAMCEEKMTKETEKSK